MSSRFTGELRVIRATVPIIMRASAHVNPAAAERPSLTLDVPFFSDGPGLFGSPPPLNDGLPQGSVLGPQSFRLPFKCVFTASSRK